MNEAQKKFLEERGKDTPLFPFDVTETKINFLLMDVECIDKHPEDFPKEMIEELKRLETPFSEHLIFYVIQEIKDFYRLAHLKFKDKITLPETADFLKTLRDDFIAHIKVETSDDIKNRCLEAEERYGFDKIYSDWKIFNDRIKYQQQNRP